MPEHAHADVQAPGCGRSRPGARGGPALAVDSAALQRAAGNAAIACVARGRAGAEHGSGRRRAQPALGDRVGVGETRRSTPTRRPARRGRSSRARWHGDRFERSVGCRTGRQLAAAAAGAAGPARSPRRGRQRISAASRPRTRAVVAAGAGRRGAIAGGEVAWALAASRTLGSMIDRDAERLIDGLRARRRARRHRREPLLTPGRLTSRRSGVAEHRWALASSSPPLAAARGDATGQPAREPTLGCAQAAAGSSPAFRGSGAGRRLERRSRGVTRCTARAATSRRRRRHAACRRAGASSVSSRDDARRSGGRARSRSSSRPTVGVADRARRGRVARRRGAVRIRTGVDVALAARLAAVARSPIRPRRASLLDEPRGRDRASAVRRTSRCSPARSWRLVRLVAVARTRQLDLGPCVSRRSGRGSRPRVRARRVTVPDASSACAVSVAPARSSQRGQVAPAVPARTDAVACRSSLNAPACTTSA